MSAPSPPLVLSKQQTALVQRSDATLTVQDEDGHEIGVLVPHVASERGAAVELKPEIVQELIRRMSQENIRWATTQEVLQRLGQRNAS